MEITSTTVFVLGAGFTRSALPKAPLTIDDYGGQVLLDQLAGMPHAAQILGAEISRNKGKIDLERLMTRLDGKMPYDSERGMTEELEFLLSKLKNSFLARISEAKKDAPQAALARFAKAVVRNSATCITFNYDDVLDRALFDVEKLTRIPGDGTKYWHPDGGYGWFCRPVSTCLGDSATYFMDRTSMLLLKLHGSINWRIRRGSSLPYDIDAIVHDEDWLPGWENSPELVRHLERDPFIVPPVLMKSALSNQPLLRLTWSLAYEVLAKADHVVFVGYSLPLTDMASATLISSRC